MFHLENKKQQRKEGRKRWNWDLHDICAGEISAKDQSEGLQGLKGNLILHQRRN